MSTDKEVKDIWSILRRRFPEREYALMSEVSDAAGFNRSRSADFIAVGLWPSRGLSINGIELKSFRSDWLSELKKPEKAENIFKYCDYFWLLTTDDTIAKIEEIPETWGWLSIKGDKIFLKKEAPKLSPQAISRNFLAAMLKRAQDKSKFVHIDSIQDKIIEARTSGRNERERHEATLEKDLNQLRKDVEEFEKVSGVDLRYYPRYSTSPTKMAEAFKFIHKGGAVSIKEQLLQLEKTAKNIHDGISKGLKSFEDN